MTIKRDFWAALVVVAAFASVGNAAIVSVTEVGLGSDTPAIISSGFGDGALAYSDRTHVHKDAQFDGSGTLSTTGSTTVPIPAYLDGNEYVRFANDARDNNPYVAVVEADEQVDWYLLIDNRLDGVAGTVTSSNTTDPVLGGVLAWVPLGNWQRVNTGISPNGQADYTSIDEDANGSLNQFFSI
ncbi:MAG: hypothetical protein KDA60_14550, partial [Planctomycetales bacterium]|nr:hypothetical protein [Planctomycetales bacterium]